MIIETIKQKFYNSFKELDLEAPLMDEIEIEHPKHKEYGDYSCNIALKKAKSYKTKPLKLAKDIASTLDKDNFFAKVEAIKPGFINIYISKKELRDILLTIHETGEDFGRNTQSENSQKVLLEFVSANPTGPLNVVNARAAAFGDSLAKIMNFLGHEVQTEYYINDAGNQIDILIESVEVELNRLAEMPVKEVEGGYKNQYIREVADEILEEEHQSIFRTYEANKEKKIRKYALDGILKRQKESLLDFNVFFDNWISEQALRDKGSVEDVLSYLAETDYIYEKDDAMWVSTSKFGDDKDRVIMKGDGTTTYLIPDLAYHISKYKRGFNQLIDILGPDHHGHTKKLQAGMKILGYDIDILNFIILQQVNFIIGDKKVKMSKREGNIFTLDQLIDEVGTDASRFFFLMRKSNSPLDFDIELAKKQSSENPVYYVQYAHARINSLEKKVSKEGIKFKNFKPEYLKRLRYEEEWNLIRKLMKFPELLVHISATQSVHLLTSYLIGLASTYHTFYQKRRVVNKRYKELSLARLYLCKATQIVLANGLRLLGISAPKEM